MDNKNGNVREHLGSRLGFILLSAGCAIGIGNVWKFPYMAGQYGGGIFVLFYIIFLAIMGIPVMTMEFALGRASQRSPAKLYQQLEPKGSKWHIHGYASVLGNYILMMFYTVVSGWMLIYFVKAVSGEFNDQSAAAIKTINADMMGDPVLLTIAMAVVVVVGFLVCSFSLQKGLEKVTKIMMIALLVIMVGLAIYGFFTPGAAEGLAFYLIPSVDKIYEVGGGNLWRGLGQVIVGAMTQAFFTLSLGIGSMAIFGSYLKKDRSLMGEAVNVAVLDTFVAIVSGLIIFPACFSYGVEAGGGPPLIFETLPLIFGQMGPVLGRVLGGFFFLFLSFAALSTIFAVFENIIACTRDIFGWSRKKACLINGILMFFLSLPCVFGFNLLSGITPFGPKSSIMDLEDFIVSNVMLPLGSLVFVLFCTSRYGWGWKKFTAEANEGKGLKVPNWIRFYASYILPVIILVFFIIGIINYF